MEARFRGAKSAFLCSKVLGIAIGILAVAVVFVPEQLGWVIGGISLLVLVGQQYASQQFRADYSAAEEVRRTFLLCDGLGTRISDVDMTRLRLRFGDLATSSEDAYYTSHLPPGPDRLLMLTWESAFWSVDLQERIACRFWWLAAGTTGLAIIAVAAALHGPEGPLVLKVIPAALALLVGVNFWGNWWDATQVASACGAVCQDCRSRIQRGASMSGRLDELREVLQVVVGYCATMLTASPASDKLYQQRRPFLNKEWDRIVAELANSGEERVVGEDNV